MIISCGKIIWTAKGLHPSELLTAMNVATGKSGQTYRIDVDCLAYYHKGRSVAGGSHESAMNNLKRKFKILMYEGFQVRAVVDGPLRPDCKRSSWERIQEKEFARVNHHFSSQMAMSKQALLDSNDPSVDIPKLKKEIKSLSTESQNLEKKTGYEVPKDLVSQIEDMIHNELYKNDGYTEDNIHPYVFESKFQADSMIAYRIKSGKSDFGLTPDSDFGWALGPNHFIIRNILQFSKDGVTEQRCEISGYSNDLMVKIKAVLPTHNRIIWKKADYPVFDTPSAKLRCLAAITIGCDIWPGIHQQGAKKVYDFLQKLPATLTMKEREDAFIGFMIQKNNNIKTRSLRRCDRNDMRPPAFDKEVINTLVSALMDEPAVRTDCSFLSDWNYMFGTPNKLPQYLYYFDKYGHIPPVSSSDDSSSISSSSSFDSDDVLSYTKDNDVKKNDRRKSLESRDYASPFDYENPGIKSDFLSRNMIQDVDAKAKPVLPNDDAGSRDKSDKSAVESDFTLDDLSNDEACLNEETRMVSFASDVVFGKKGKVHRVQSSDNTTEESEPKEDQQEAKKQTSRKLDPNHPSNWGKNGCLFGFFKDPFPFGDKGRGNKSNVIDDCASMSSDGSGSSFVMVKHSKPKNVNESCTTESETSKPGGASKNNVDESVSSASTSSSKPKNVNESCTTESETSKPGGASKNNVDESVSSASTSSSDSSLSSSGYSSDVFRGSAPKIKIVPGPPLGYCKGIIGATQPHYYLEADGTWFCAECEESFCRTCGYVPERLTPGKKKKAYYVNKNKNLCFMCYKTCPINGVENGTETEQIEATEEREASSFGDLKKKLRELNVTVQDDMLYYEAEDLYQYYVHVRPLYERIAGFVDYPVHSSSFFEEVTSRVFFNGRVFSPEGFFSDPKVIPDDLLLKIVKLFSKFVEYEKEGESRYSSSVPSNVIKFANGSRPGGQTAHKMIKSTMRHALDDRIPPVLYNDFSLFHDKGEDGEPVVGVILENLVPASMKNQHYNTKIAITCDELLACSCNCLSSGEFAGDRVACIHNLPLFYQVTLLLHSGLSLYFLHDLAARWNQDLEILVSKNRDLYHEMRQCIIYLIRSTNLSIPVLLKVEGHPVIRDMLEEFQVTTEKTKIPVVVPPQRHEIIPFRFLPVESVETKNKKRKNLQSTDITTQKPSKSSITQNHMLEKRDDCKIGTQLNEEDDTDSDASSTSNDEKKKDTDGSTPHVDSSTPHVDSSTPHVDSSTPQVDSSTPHVDSSTPHVDSSTPHVHSSTQPHSISETHVDDSDDDFGDVPPPMEPRYGRPPPFYNNNSEVDILAYRLNTFEKQQVINATQENLPENVEIESYNRLTQTLYTGRQSKWLNDEIINGYVKLLTIKDSIENPNDRSYIHDHHFFFFLNETISGYNYENVKNWSEKYPHVDIFNNVRYFITPINLNNQHWAKTFVYFPGKVIGYVDSMGMDGEQIMRIILRYLEDYARDHNLPFDRSEWTFKNFRKRAPQQNNFDDCGAFLLINAYLCICNVPMLYSQRGVDACESRKIIALSLLRGDALCPISISRRAQPQLNVRGKTSKQHISQNASTKKSMLMELPTSNNKTGSNKSTNITTGTTTTKAPNANATEAQQGIKDDKYISMVDTSINGIYPIAEYDSFKPDYIRVNGWIKAIFKKEYPKNFVGYNLLEVRAAKEKESLRDTAGEREAEAVVKRKETTAYFDHRSLVSVSKEDMQTDNMKDNMNGTTVDVPSMPTNRKYGEGVVRTCSYKGCNSTRKTCVAFERLPKAPKKIEEKVIAKKRPRTVKSYYRRLLLNKLALEHCGLPEDTQGEHRICSRHKKHMYKVQKVINREDKKPLGFNYTFVLPVPHQQLTLNKESGLGADRYKIKEIKNMPNNELKSMTMFSMVTAERLDARQKGGNNPQYYINESVQSLLDIEDSNISKRLKCSAAASGITAKRGINRSFHMRDTEVKDRTGFPSKALMLGFIAIVCNGDIKQMLGTLFSTMTWWEEWFLLFEMLWGRTRLNQKDLVKEYRTNAIRKNMIVDRRMAQILKCRNSWPKYPSLEEDVLLRSEKWDGVIGKMERMIQHDSTNINMAFQPTLAGCQKITYNQYYGGSCAKADVELSPCGFQNGNHLFVGGCSDSQYMLDCRIFEEQQRFQEEDKINGHTITFTNVLDRGYKLNLKAYRCGKQTIYQPMFRKKGKRFTGNETLRSASCATVRSGNERAVRRGKLAGFLKKGLRPSESPRRLDDAWLAWNFMTNFMYQPCA